MMFQPRKSLLSKLKGAILPEKTLQINPLEIKLDKSTCAMYVIISPIVKYIPHKYRLEDLIDDKKTLAQLEIASLGYLFYAYGIIKAASKNELYVLEEILYLEYKVRVKQLKSMEYEIWDRLQFEQNYLSLDKESIMQGAKFFYSNINDTAPKLRLSK